MTNPFFVVSSVEKSPTGRQNWPVNVSHCTCLTKDRFLSADPIVYLIWFEGCVNSHNEVFSWGYPTEQERDADYDRILKVFAGSTEEPEPEPVSGGEVLEDVINWLNLNATGIVYSRPEYKVMDLVVFWRVMDLLLSELRKAMLAEKK